MTRLTTVQPEQMMETFNINTVAPLMIIKALLGLLKESVGQNQSHALKQPLIVNISSILGSIAENNEQAGSTLLDHEKSGIRNIILYDVVFS